MPVKPGILDGRSVPHQISNDFFMKQGSNSAPIRICSTVDIFRNGVESVARRELRD